MNKNFKIILAFVYMLSFGILLYFIFHYLDFKDFKDLNDYSYIRDKSEILLDFKDKKLFLFIFLFFIFSIIWVLFLGFASPLAIMSGFIFGKWYGTIISVFSFTIGCTLLYILAKFYLKNFIEKKLGLKIAKYKNFFNKNEFFYFMIFRIIGGAGTPFAVQNILPVIFDMKLKNYFYSTFLGLIPTIFIVNSLGEGIEKIIQNNEQLNYLNFISDPAIYWPITCFIILLITSFFVKKKLFKE